MSHVVQQEALTRLLMENGIFTKEEFLEMVRVVGSGHEKKRMKRANQIYCDYCGIELKNHSFFYKIGRFIGEDLVCPVCFDEYFKGNTGKDRVWKYDSETVKKIEG